VPLYWHNGDDEEHNLLPACRSCNHYKSTLTIDEFREQIAKWPERLMRDSVTYKNAVRYGLVTPNIKPVVFYFEKLENESRSGRKAYRSGTNEFK
ncbi:MAG: hypothetical protein ACRDBM_00965, partial [Sporomusa sp.]